MMQIINAMNKNLKENLEALNEGFEVAFWEGVEACFETMRNSNVSNIDEVKEVISREIFPKVFGSEGSKPTKKENVNPPKKEAKTKSEKKSRSVPLPFSGHHYKKCCNALKSNYGLYTQCMNIKAEDSNYCSPDCEAHSRKYGTIIERMENFKLTNSYSEYRDRENKKAKKYSSIISSKEFTEDEILGQVERMSELLGERFVFDKIHMNKTAQTKKTSTKIEEESNKNEEKKNEEDEILNKVFNDVSSNSKNNINKVEKEEANVNITVNDKTEDDDELNVDDLEMTDSEGNSLYKNSNNSEVYTIQDDDIQLVGYWNENTNTVDFITEKSYNDY